MGKIVFIVVLLVVGYFMWVIATQAAGVRACYETNADRYETMEMNKARYGSTLQKDCEGTYATVMDLGSCLRGATISAGPTFAKNSLANIAFGIVRLIRPGLRTNMEYTKEHNEACSAYDYFMIP